jgi:hypothetical protein
VLRVLATSLTATVMAACAIDAPADDATVDSRVTVLSHVPGLTMTVLPDQLEFPRADNDALLTIHANDIVVSGTGEGFLRKVTGVEAGPDRIVITTTEADLSDAVIDGTIRGSFGGEGKADTYQLPTIGFAVTDHTVLQNPYMTVKLANASLSLAPEIDLDIDIEDRALSLFELVVRGKLRGSIDLDIDARDITVGPDIVLWQSPPTFFYQQLGILPVVETVTTSVHLKIEVVARGRGRLRINAGATADLEAGIRYTDAGGWDPVANANVTAYGSVPEATIPALEQLGVRAWLVARADLKLYGLAGPYVGMGPQIEVVQDLVEHDLDGRAGFRGEVGGELKIGPFNILRALPELTLFDTIRPVF